MKSANRRAPRTAMRAKAKTSKPAPPPFDEAPYRRAFEAILDAIEPFDDAKRAVLKALAEGLGRP